MMVRVVPAQNSLPGTWLGPKEGFRMISIASSFPYAPSDSSFERFLSKIDSSGECWVWTAYTRRDGYGRIKIGRKMFLSHRKSFLWSRGYLTEGLQIDHLCRNHSCVNPDHLEEVTQRENILRGEGKCAMQARQTHCVRGHELTEENTRRRLDYPAKRLCKKCAKIRDHSRWLRVKELRDRKSVV